MVTIIYEDTPISYESGDSLLDSLLRRGIEVPYGCRSGVCQSCLVRGDGDGDWSSAQKGLSDAQCAQNLLLSCQCDPERCISDVQSLQIYPVDHLGMTHSARVEEKQWLNSQVLGLTLSSPQAITPGQYLTLWKDASLGRSYSVAACDARSDGKFDLQFHIRCYRDGVFSQWLAEACGVGAELQWRGPMGNCIYTDEREKPLLMAGVGTGLAPLWGVVNEAIKAQHSGPIDVVLAARESAGLYFQEEFQRLAAQAPNLNIHWVVQEFSEQTFSEQTFSERTLGNKSHIVRANIYDYIADKFPALSNYGVFLCGAESFVSRLRRQCFLAGAGMSSIKADAFLSASST